MPNCPNCGQPTSRTQDWACPWCGYPLLSKSFRPIQKTYRELKGERQPEGRLPSQLEAEPAPKPEFEAVAEVRPEPVAEVEPEAVVEVEPEPVVEIKPEPVAEVEPKRRRKRVPKAKPEPAPEPEPEPEPVAQVEAEPVEAKPRKRRRKQPEPVVEPELKPVAEAEPVVEPELKPAAEAEPEPVVEPELKPVAEAEPEPTVELGAEVSPGLVEVGIEGLYAAFAKDQEAADARYRDKTLRVTGLLYRTVINENLDVAYIILTSAKKYGDWKVSCTFTKEHENELRQLTAEQTLTVEGKYEGYRVNVQMKDCVLVH